MSKLPTDRNAISGESVGNLLARYAGVRNTMDELKYQCISEEYEAGVVEDEDFRKWYEDRLASGELTGEKKESADRFFVLREQLLQLERDIQALPGRCQSEATKELAYSFPSLREAEGLAPYDETRFAKWVEGHGGVQGLHAGWLIICICGNRDEGFNLAQAFEVWDNEHRDAFINWLKRPFAPHERFWGDYYYCPGHYGADNESEFDRLLHSKSKW